MDKREGVSPERPTEPPSVPPPPPPPRGYARNGGYCHCGSWDRHIAELEAEVAELRKDKARLDWLGKQYACVSSGGAVNRTPDSWIVDLVETPDAWLRESLRDAIDAARRNEPA